MQNHYFNVTCNTDDNYVQHCAAMLCSLFENNKKHTFNVHLLIETLSESSRIKLNDIAHSYGNIITYHKVDSSHLRGVKFRKNRPLTMAAYYRMLLPSILNGIDLVLYLDCDMIIMDDISELFELNLNNYALAASGDEFPYTDLHRRQLEMPVGTRTFCSGMMVINLSYWRYVNAEERLIEYAKRDREVVYLHDQDALNYVFKNQWYLLPPKWNHVAGSFYPTVINDLLKAYDVFEYIFKPKIMHYAGEIKPWYNVLCPDGKFYKYYLQKSNFVGFSFTDFPKKMSFIFIIKYLINRIGYYFQLFIFKTNNFYHKSYLLARTPKI